MGVAGSVVDEEAVLEELEDEDGRGVDEVLGGGFVVDEVVELECFELLWEVGVGLGLVLGGSHLLDEDGFGLELPSLNCQVP